MPEPPTAFDIERLLVAMRPRLHRYCARMVGSVIDGEDVLQDALAKAIEAHSTAGNIGNPFAPLYYGISLMHCMTVSLAYGGAGLGAVWGIEKAKAMLAEAGFGRVEVLDSPRPQNCIYVCRK